MTTQNDAWDAYDFDAFLQGYEDAADFCGLPDDDDEKINSIGWHKSTLDTFRSDCLDFAQDNVLTLVASGLHANSAGADFWFTRNRHGAGYWDRGYKQSDEAKQALEVLTDAAHVYREAELYVGDDGWIYQYGAEPR